MNDCHPPRPGRDGHLRHKNARVSVQVVACALQVGLAVNTLADHCRTTQPNTSQNITVFSPFRSISGTENHPATPRGGRPAAICKIKVCAALHLPLALQPKHQLQTPWPSLVPLCNPPPPPPPQATLHSLLPSLSDSSPRAGKKLEPEPASPRSKLIFS